MIHGLTITGNAGTLVVTAAGFDFYGCADDTATIERIRKGRCIYDEATGAGAQRANGIQRGCEVQRPYKAHIHDHEQHGAFPEEIPIYPCEPDTG
ncbi:hypothetical protein UNSWDHB_2656 [Dehalobacter sp. UNSWDHB]|nr:hypothetical protein UNSWDHB_2656 [Dehalobacter sp. UNSWDHB]